MHSDSDEGIQRLNQEAAKAMTRGARAGLSIPPERAIRWLTANPARALGIDELTGTLEAGKMGDVVIWNGDSVQRLRARRAGVHRRRAGVRPRQSAAAAEV